MRLRVYHGPALAAYGFPDGHPFGPDRLAAFWQEFTRRGLEKRVELAPPVACTRADLARFHASTYIDAIERLSASGHGYLDMGDTPAFPGVYEAACAVAGSVLDAAGAMLDGRCA